MLSQVLPPAPETEPLLAAVPSAIATSGNAETANTVKAFHVYKDFADESNHFSPSGWMGDYERIRVDTCSNAPSPSAHGGIGAVDIELWPHRATTITYLPDSSDSLGWAGVYWLEPSDNWGVVDQGFDLSPYKVLTFRAKSSCLTSYRGYGCSGYSSLQVKFFVGGVSENVAYPSSIQKPIYPQEADRQGFVTLTDAWQEFHVDLAGADLHHVFDGFGVAFDQIHTPAPFRASIDVDDIQFTSAEP
jgi:hypothetical protein